MAKKYVDRKHKLYVYTGGKYLRQELSSARGCKAYRVKTIDPQTKLLVCVTSKKGKRGGKTKAVAILRSPNKDLRRYNKRGRKYLKRALKKARKLLKN